MALLLTGCGGAIDNRDRATSVRSVAAPMPAPVAQPTPRAHPPPDPPARVPTRLVGGPALFRLVDGAHGGGRPELRYAMIFRLNRPAVDLPRAKDPGAPTPLPGGAVTRLGNYTIGALAWAYDSPIGSLDLYEKPDVDNCFLAEVEDDPPGLTRGLDRVPLGARVRVRLRPLTPTGDGFARLGRKYVRHPRLQVLRVVDFGGSSYVRDPVSRAKLRRTGCASNVL